jgi:choline dehydrogenase-like flavoprotein
MVALSRNHELLHGHTAAKRPPGVFGREDICGDTLLGCDVVVVGSGAGGATLGAELAEAGFDVIILEEGGYVGTRDFTPQAAAMIRTLYRDAGASAAIGRPPILFQEGRVVGGSSVINGGMSWRTPERILDEWEHEHGLDGLRAATMEPYFERVERRIHVAYQDPETIGKDAEIVRRGAEAKRWSYVSNLRNQLHCAGSNNCAFGCPTGAKQSTLVTYIPRALHHGARIYSNVKVAAITRRGKRATGITGHVVNADRSRGHAITVQAKLVVAACGSIHTPALLHRSGVRSPSGQLGKNLSMHPNVKVVAVFDEEVRGWEGVHQAFQIREFEAEGITNITAVNVPPSIIAMSVHHHGRELGALLKDYSRTVVAGLLCEDTSTGRLRMAPGGRPVAFYDVSDFDLDRIKRGAVLLCELLLEQGARRIVMPFGGVGEVRNVDDARRILSAAIPRESIEMVTVHVMGTARMGGSRAGAVTDGFGKVYDTEALFIADASLFPSAVGVNPAETIQALATRNAAHIIENRGRYLA